MNNNDWPSLTSCKWQDSHCVSKETAPNANVIGSERFSAGKLALVSERLSPVDVGACAGEHSHLARWLAGSPIQLSSPLERHLTELAHFANK